MLGSGRLTRTPDLRRAFAAHAGELYGVARRALGDPAAAEEAVQETFLRAWRHGRRFDPALGSLRTWLFAILRNVIVDQVRARDSRPRLVDLTGVEVADHGDAFDRVLVAWQVEEALRRLSDEHRRVLVEVHLRDRPVAEVAAELGIPEGTVRSRVFYALRALRLHLEEMGWDDERR